MHIYVYGDLKSSDKNLVRSLQSLGHTVSHEALFPDKNPDLILCPDELPTDYRKQFPEKTKVKSVLKFVSEQFKNKKVVVVTGSHGKSVLLSMLIHALHHADVRFDYYINTPIHTFENTLKISTDAEIALIELPINVSADIFKELNPLITVVTTIDLTDHKYGVHPEKFQTDLTHLLKSVPSNGALCFHKGDYIISNIIKNQQLPGKIVEYFDPVSFVYCNTVFWAVSNDDAYPLHIFGEYNLLSLKGAFETFKLIGLQEEKFYQSIQNYKAIPGRMDQLYDNPDKLKVFYLQSINSSRIIAAIDSIKQRYENEILTVVLELEADTFSNMIEMVNFSDVFSECDEPIIFSKSESFDEEFMHSQEEKIIAVLDDDRIMFFSDAVELQNHLMTDCIRRDALLIVSDGTIKDQGLTRFIDPLIEE